MKDTEPQEDKAGGNSFLATLQRHRGGRLLAQASGKLAEVVAGVHDTGKAGTVTLTLTIKPAQRGQSAVVVTDKLTGKVPTLEAEASFWFATPAGQLCKEDPRQTTFEMGIVDGARAEKPVSVSAAVA
jgi:hypothetical protein